MEFNNTLNIFVDASASVCGDGTAEKPLQNIEQAKLAVRKSVKSREYDEINVVFRQGRYEVSESIIFTNEDSGKESCPVKYIAFDNEEVIFDGGITVCGSELEKVSKEDPIYERIPEASREYVRVFDFSKYSSFGEMDFTRKGSLKHGLEPYSDGPENVCVTYNRQWMSCSRYPKYDLMKTGNMLESGGAGYLEYEIPADKAKKWCKADQAYVKGPWVAEWDVNSLPVDRISLETNTVKTRIKPRYHPVSKGSNFYINNLIEELELDNEYFVDKNNFKLYIMPYKRDLKNGEFNNAIIQIPMMKKALISLNGAEHITFEGLIFENSRGLFFDMENVKYCTIFGCTMRNTAVHCINISGKDCLENTVDSCDMYGTGACMIHTSDIGDMPKCISSKTTFINNKLHDSGRISKTNQPPIFMMNTVGVYAAYNEIFDCPHSPITHRGQEFLFEYNDIYDSVTLKLWDAGSGIHSGADIKSLNFTMRYNYFHNNNPRSQSVIYWDDCISQNKTYGNIFYKTGQAFFTHGGMNNDFNNNVVIYPASDEMYTATWSTVRPSFAWTVIPEGEGQKRTIVPVVGATNFVNSDAVECYESEIFRNKYPEFVKYVNREKVDLSLAEAKNNVTIYSEKIPDHESIISLDPKNTIVNKANNLQTLDDIGFTDIKNGDFNLADDAVIYKINPDFEPIPFDKMGRFENKYSKKNKLEKPILIYPDNGENDIEGVSVTFTWRKQSDTRNYLFELALDKGFENIVKSEIIDGENIRVKYLMYDRTTYYWRVTALDSNSKMLDRGSEEVSEIYCFTTALEENIDLTVIDNFILKCEKLYSKIEEGDAAGQYFIGTKSEMERLISDVNALKISPNLSTQYLESNFSVYEKWYDRIKGKRNEEILLIDDILHPGDTIWSTQPNRGYYRHGRFEWTRNERQDNRNLYYLEKPIDNNQILRFKFCADFHEMENVASKWFGWMLRAIDTNRSTIDSTGYIVIMKPDQNIVELQRFNRPAENLFVSYKTELEYGRFYEVEFGAVDTSDGSVRIIFKLDGKTIIDYCDFENSVKDAGYFGLTTTSSNIGNTFIIEGINYKPLS